MSLSVYYWKFAITTSYGDSRNLLVKEEAESPVDAKNKAIYNIILMSKNGIPRFYFNDKYICLSHSNDERMLTFDYVEIDSSLLQKISITPPEMILPEFLKKQGLNYKAKPFIPL